MKKKTPAQQNARDIWYNNWAGFVYSPVGKRMKFNEWANDNTVPVCPPVEIQEGPKVYAIQKRQKRNQHSSSQTKQAA
jgi:hypothetical protein